MPVAIFSIIGYCLALAAVTRQDPDDMPPLVVPGLILGLYAGALMGMLAQATHLILAGGVILLGWRLVAWVRFARSRKRPTGAQFSLTPGILLFAVGSCLLVVLAAHSAYWDWDEFSHWGLAIKDLAAHHALWDGADAVHFYDYPPGTALFQYVMLIPGGFSEGRTHAAQGILMLAFLIPLIKRSPPDAPMNVLFRVRACAIVAVAFALVHLFGNGVFTLYVDGLLGLILGATLVAYLLAPPFSRLAIIRAVLCLALLALVKSSGLLLALIGAGVIAADLAWGTRTAPPPRRVRFFKNHRARVITLSCMLFGVALIVFAPWYIRTQTIRTAGVMPHHMMPGHEAPGQPGVTPAQRRTVVRQFAHALTTRTIGTLNVSQWVQEATRQAGVILPHMPEWMCLSPLVWSMLVALCLALQQRAPPHAPGFRRLALAHTVLALGGGLYLAGLLWVYCYSFRATEALTLASFGRYVGTYGVAWLMVLVTVPLVEPAATRGSPSFVLKVCIAVLLAALAVATTVSPVLPPILSARRESVRDMATAVRARTAPDSRLFHVCQNSDGFDHHIMSYELAPRLTEYWGWSLGTHPADAGDTNPVPASVWATRLADYDYVLLGCMDARFAERYGMLFADPVTLPAHRLFAVRHRADGSLRLEAVD